MQSLTRFATTDGVADCRAREPGPPIRPMPGSPAPMPPSRPSDPPRRPRLAVENDQVSATQSRLTKRESEISGGHHPDA